MNHQYHASNSKLLLHSTDIQSPNHLTRFLLFYCGGISTTALSSKYLRSSYNSSHKRDIFDFLTLPYSNGRTYCRFVELGDVQPTSPMCGGDFVGGNVSCWTARKKARWRARSRWLKRRWRNRQKSLAVTPVLFQEDSPSGRDCTKRGVQ